MTPELTQDIVEGGYWRAAPDTHTQAVIAYTGAVAPEAAEAARALNARGIPTALLAITSYDRLYEGWSNAARAPSQVQALLDAVPTGALLFTVIDGHPSALAWLGGAGGHRTTALGVRKFGESGSVGDLYRINGIDAAGIEHAVEAHMVKSAASPARQTAGR